MKRVVVILIVLSLLLLVIGAMFVLFQPYPSHQAEDDPTLKSRAIIRQMRKRFGQPPDPNAGKP